MKGCEDISDEPISHAKYTGVVYSYITNSFGSSNPVWPQKRVLSQTWVRIIIIYLLHGIYPSIYVPPLSVQHLLLVQNFKMTPEASGTLAAKVELQYFCMLLRGEVRFQFDNLCAHVVVMPIENLNQVVLVLGTYFWLSMCCSNKRAQCATE